MAVLLIGTIKPHVKKYEKIDPDFVSKVLRYFYVDDFNCVWKVLSKI